MPENQDLEDDCNDYYYVYFDNLSVEGTIRAMFCNDEWYTSYISKLIYPVTHWMPLPKPPEAKS